jgi:hypothetical protein
MPVIERPRTIQSSGQKRNGKVVQKLEHSEPSTLCAFRDICRSGLSQFTNNDCLGSSKGN